MVVTATFENFTEGDTYYGAFTDPLSGITFHHSTSADHNFVIEYSNTQFGGGNYLTAEGWSPGPAASWVFGFGFMGDLPMPATRLRIGVTYGSGDTSSVLLEAFDSVGGLIAQQSGSPGAPRPFFLEVDSPQYNIVSFRASAGNNISTGYDNISYTIAPEPTSLALVLAGAATVIMSRHKR